MLQKRINFDFNKQKSNKTFDYSQEQGSIRVEEFGNRKSYVQQVLLKRKMKAVQN